MQAMQQQRAGDDGVMEEAVAKGRLVPLTGDESQHAREGIAVQVQHGPYELPRARPLGRVGALLHLVNERLQALETSLPLVAHAIGAPYVGEWRTVISLPWPRY